MVAVIRTSRPPAFLVGEAAAPPATDHPRCTCLHLVSSQTMALCSLAGREWYRCCLCFPCSRSCRTAPKPPPRGRAVAARNGGERCSALPRSPTSSAWTQSRPSRTRPTLADLPRPPRHHRCYRRQGTGNQNQTWRPRTPEEACHHSEAVPSWPGPQHGQLLQNGGGWPRRCPSCSAQAALAAPTAGRPHRHPAAADQAGGAEMEGAGSSHPPPRGPWAWLAPMSPQRRAEPVLMLAAQGKRHPQTRRGHHCRR